MEKIATWKGKPVEELSKEELIEALDWAANEIQRLMKEKELERNLLEVVGILLARIKELEEADVDYCACKSHGSEYHNGSAWICSHCRRPRR